MNIVEYAENELKILEDSCTDEESLNMQKVVNGDILNIIKIFAEQHHSGFSANYVLNLLERLLRFKPLTPIEDKQDEWIDCSKYGVEIYQHKRCSSVFKRKDGTAFWTEGKIFTEDNGKSWYTCKDSSVNITFPFDVPLHSENVYVEPDEKIKEEEVTSEEE